MQKSLDDTQLELRNYNRDILTHTHAHNQLVLPIKGVLEMDIDGFENTVMTSTAAVIPAGQPHSCASSGENSFLIVDIPAQKRLLENTATGLWSAVGENPFVEVDTSVLGYCNFLATEIQASPFSRLDKSMSGAMLVNALARAMGVNNEVLSPMLARAVQFIEAQFSNPLAIKDIARAAGASESRLHAQFNSHFDMSPKRYVTILRLKHAAAMLGKTKLDIAEIALRVGYSDQSAFTRAFQRHMGISPSKYRYLDRN